MQHLQAGGRPCSLLTRPVLTGATAAAVAPTCSSMRSSRVPASCSTHSHNNAAARAGGGSSDGRSSRVARSCAPSPASGAVWTAAADAPADATAAAATASRPLGQQSQPHLPDNQPTSPAEASAHGAVNSSSSSSAKAVLQPVTYTAGHSLPPQPNWQAGVAALQVCWSLFAGKQHAERSTCLAHKSAVGCSVLSTVCCRRFAVNELCAALDQVDL